MEGQIMLEGSSVYLAGPIEHADDATSWRDEITPRLRDMGLLVYNPLVKPDWTPCRYVDGDGQKLIKDAVLNNEGKAIEVNKSIRKCGRRLAATADFIICYLPKSSTFGTFEEINIGSADGKPVLFICPDGDSPPSSWLIDQFVSDDEKWSEVFFWNIDDLCQSLFEVHNSNRGYDPYKWIFLTWPKGEY
jgi:hypothetical protein